MKRPGIKRGPYKKKSIKDRFWSYVKKSKDCWWWTGTKDKAGYGGLGVGAGMVRAHRLSWCLHNGSIPDGIHVLHKCDNPPCVRPDHLFLGTQADNIKDMLKKGRWKPKLGENHPSSKLKVKDVYKIRQLHVDGIKRDEIAERFNIAISTVEGIIYRTRWRHI